MKKKPIGAQLSNKNHKKHRISFQITKKVQNKYKMLGQEVNKVMSLSRKVSVHTALNELDDNRVTNMRPLIPPQILMEDLPLSQKANVTAKRGRSDAEAIIKGLDDRLVVIVGPCSVHDINAAREYAMLLKQYADSASDDLCIIMRVYFQKPRTTVGWKGLINDPTLDQSFQINKGLRLARSLLLEINEIGLPAAVEYLDTISPQYIADCVAWGAIGARTTESQVHRELASGLSCPVGFKNATNGNVQIAIDAIQSASAPHNFLSVTKQGLTAIVETAGNNFCHVILRGGQDGPNYSSEHVMSCVSALRKAKLSDSLMVDASHGNSQKQHKLQLKVVESIVDQMTSHESGLHISGVMIESHLKEGRQDIPASGPQDLVYGQSITDACIHWDDTVVALDMLRKGVQARRQRMSMQI